MSDSGTRNFYIGLDLGQAQDYTALTVIEQIETEKTDAQGRALDGYHLRHVERFELGTPYPNQVRRVEELMQTAPLRGCGLVADQTGVGRAVVDLFREADLEPTGVTITGGSTVSRPSGTEWSVPKKELVSTVQSLLQTGRLKFAEGLPLAGVLTEELQNFRAKINAQTGHTSFEH